jgi:putative hydrolase of the HAD superfamily
MAKGLIFDLDNCLAAAREVGEELFERPFAAIRDANQGTVSEKDLRHAFADMWRHPLDWVAARYHFSEAMLAAGRRIFVTLEVTRPMTGYEDLATLAQLPVQRFLVTSGFRRLQESKIKALGLGHLFTAIYVDAIDEPGRVGKERVFAQIMTEYGFAPSEVLIVGDNAEAEIAAGNRLGIPTVQMLRPGVPRASNAMFHVHSLAELKRFLSNSANP